MGEAVDGVVVEPTDGARVENGEVGWKEEGTLDRMLDGPVDRVLSWPEGGANDSMASPVVSSKSRSEWVLFKTNIIVTMVICAFLSNIFLFLPDRR